jgi:hypothetical protein
MSASAVVHAPATPLPIGATVRCNDLFKDAAALLAKGKLSTTVTDISTRFCIPDRTKKDLVQCDFKGIEQWIADSTKVPKIDIEKLCKYRGKSLTRPTGWSDPGNAYRHDLYALVAHVLACQAANPPVATPFWKSSSITLPVPSTPPPPTPDTQPPRSGGSVTPPAEQELLDTTAATVASRKRQNEQQELEIEDLRAKRLKAELDRETQLMNSPQPQPQPEKQQPRSSEPTAPSALAKAEVALAKAVDFETKAFADLDVSNPQSADAASKRAAVTAASDTVQLLRKRVASFQTQPVGGVGGSAPAGDGLTPNFVGHQTTIPAAVAHALHTAHARAQVTNQKTLVQLGAADGSGRGNMNLWNPAAAVGSPLSTTLTAKIVQGGFDISFALLLKNSVEHAPGTLALATKHTTAKKASRWNLRTWDCAFDRFKAVLVSADESMGPMLSAYKAQIHLLSERFRMSNEHGFLRYDEKFRAEATRFYRQTGLHPNWALRHQNTFEMVFTGFKVTTCSYCNAADHFIEQCHIFENDASDDGGTGLPSAVPGAVAATKTKKTQSCHKYNSAGGCTFRNCKFLHACQTCQGAHPVGECTD